MEPEQLNYSDIDQRYNEYVHAPNGVDFFYGIGGAKWLNLR